MTRAPHTPGTALQERRAHLADESASLALGRTIGQWIGASRTPLRIYLSGELGTGKTTIARALLRALGVEGRIKSPSYTLVEPYVVDLPPAHGFRENLSLYCYHFDFYRFNDPREWLDAGFRDYFDGAGVCLVEWPEKAAGDARLPRPDLLLDLEVSGVARQIVIRAFTPRGVQCLTAVASSLPV
jgi:tRNA threonylcarbamoyladenosine biosynthesis protein TsaE